MASIIKIKRSGLTTVPAQLAAGELAYSWKSDTNKLYIGTGVETNGAAANIEVIGGSYYTGIVDAATSSATPNTLVMRDANGNISVGSITGTIVGNADTATKWATARDLSLTGDATATLSSVDGSANVSAALTLATVNTNVGTYGSTTSIPVITVNGKGLVTAVSTASISTSLSIGDGTATDTVALGTDTLTFAGGTGVTTAVTNNTVTFSIGQAVGTTSNVQFNNVTVDGTLYSNDITAANISVDGNATITGDLTVLGTTTTVNSTTVAIGDANIELAKDATNAAQANGAGITVKGPTVPASLFYTSADDRWNLNKDLNVGTVYGALSGNATSADKFSTARDLSLTGDATATLASFDGSANVSATLTLATVNSNVGTYGTSTAVPAITVNAKGLITGVSTNNIPTATSSVLGLASFDSTNFTVTAGAVTVATIDGGTY